MLLLFDSLAAMIVMEWSSGADSFKFPFSHDLKNRNRVRMLGMGRSLVLTVQYPKCSMHHKFIRHVFVIEKLLYNIIYLNRDYATLINNFPLVLPPVRSRCAF